MKRNALTLLESVTLSVLCAWSGASCLITAFSLPVTQPRLVWAVWLCWALLCALLLPRRWGEAGVLALAAAGAGYLWYEGSFGPQLLGTLGVLAKAYNAGYGWGIPSCLRVEATAADLPVAVLGLALIFPVSRTVCRRKGNALSVLLLLLPLAACLVVTDTVPAVGSLFGLLVCLCLLLLTDSVRRESGGQAGRLTAMAAVPVALALGLLLHFCPQSTYVNTTDQLREKLLVSLAELPRKLQEQGVDWFDGLRQKETVELSSLPAQLLLGIPVAEVTAEQSGPVYLRVQDYDVYTGTAWESSANRQDTLVGAGQERGLVTVNTLNSQASLLLPAFPDGQTFLTDGAAGNSQNQREYTVSLREASMGALPEEQWLTLPQQTGQRAKELLSAIPGPMDTVEQAAQSVADYVRSCADYDRGASSLGGEETDFALWFLERGERGYCVHFATAAAVLLRSAGIPARYVTGYRVDARAGETVKVTSDDAHAWVEYYNFRTWTWSILEATPAEEAQSAETAPETVPQTQPASQTQPTQAPATQAAQTVPTAQQPQGGQEEVRRLPLWLPLTVVSLGVAYALTELQRLARISLRRRRQSQGGTNRRAAACFREIRLLTRLLNRPVPEEVTRLTEKALFSQHTLTREELNVFLSCQSACRRCLRKAPWWKRLLYRYGYAVI